MRTFKLFAASLLIAAVSLLGGCNAGGKYAKPGYVVEEKDGRLWVFKKDSKDLADYKASGDMAKRVTRPGVGPDGKTVIAPDAETVEGYLKK